MTFRRPLLALTLTAALALAACSKKADTNAGAQPTTPLPTGPVAAVAPPAGKEWTDVATMTPEGGVKMGNPDAPVQLVEYASMVCPHCRDFTHDAYDELTANYVKKGKVSWEYRPFVLQSFDIPAFLLTRCRGPEPFFKLAEQTYAAQTDWFGKALAMTQAQQADLQATPQDQLFKKMAAITGLDAFFRVRGVPSADIDKCLSDVAAAEKLAQNTNSATNDLNVNSTPTFFLNGQKWEPQATTTALWPQLRQRLSALTGG